VLGRSGRARYSCASNRPPPGGAPFRSSPEPACAGRSTTSVATSELQRQNEQKPHITTSTQGDPASKRRDEDNTSEASASWPLQLRPVSTVGNPLVRKPLYNKNRPRGQPRTPPAAPSPPPTHPIPPPKSKKFIVHCSPTQSTPQSNSEELRRLSGSLNFRSSSELRFPRRDVGPAAQHS